MTYNPARMRFDGGKPSRQRRVVPNAGVHRNSMYAHLEARGLHVSDLSSRENTSRGWRVVHHQGDSFEVVYELICSKNTTGKVVNELLDRCVRIISGVLYICIGTEIVKLEAGKAFSIPKGTTYTLSSSGDQDVEVLFCQGKNYESTLMLLDNSNFENFEPKLRFVDTVSILDRDRISEVKSQETAKTLQQQKELKIKNRNNPQEIEKRNEVIQSREASLRTPNVVGVNLRPMGPGGLGE